MKNITTLPHIPGRDFAGVVVAGAQDWISREVWWTGGDLGFTRDGTHTEFLLLPIAAVRPKPRILINSETEVSSKKYYLDCCIKYSLHT